MGRPKGPGKSKLDDHREAIIADLKGGVTKAYISKKYGATPATLHNWLKRHKLNKIKPIFLTRVKTDTTYSSLITVKLSCLRQQVCFSDLF